MLLSASLFRRIEDVVKTGSPKTFDDSSVNLAGLRRLEGGSRDIRKRRNRHGKGKGNNNNNAGGEQLLPLLYTSSSAGTDPLSLRCSRPLQPLLQSPRPKPSLLPPPSPQPLLPLRLWSPLLEPASRISILPLLSQEV